MEIIKFENVTKSYDGEKDIIKNMNLSINKGEFVTIIGESGCGKTTLLKMINGLIEPDSGEVYVEGESLNNLDIINLRRRIGYVIQQISLFPHLSVYKNITYILDIMEENERNKRKRALQLIELVGLDSSYLEKYPRQLSGGEGQRIGVARALAAKPDIILMDEPFGAVDEITRKNLQNEILRIQRILKATVVFITHDIEEAIKLGDRIIVMNKGIVLQDGDREDIVFGIKDPYIKKFFGEKNFMAYSNVETVKKYIKPLDIEDINMEDAFEDKDFLWEDSLIIEGIRLIFNSDKKEIPVKNPKGKIIGKFSL